ncbi:MAG: hypothetical protein AAGA09_00200 [Pseudomonadota bacterium]
MTPSRLPIALFIVRASVTAFFAIWAVEKFVKPETTVAIWKGFYHVPNLPLEASYAIGALQGLVLICFFFGVLKFWSYGFLMLMHGATTVMTYERLIDPYTGPNHLFWAAVPTLGALVALYLLRHEDTFLTISSKIKALS